MLIILFVDDRAKQLWTYTFCESGKKKFISGAADFSTAAQHGAVMAFITDHNNKFSLPQYIHFPLNGFELATKVIV